jgi:predicted ATPase/DNA-binding CsgD family transcriptional regulator
LRHCLLDTIDSLASPPDSRMGVAARRIHHLLTLRYVEELPVKQIQVQLAVSKSGYYRLHADGILAVMSVLLDRWQLGNQDNQQTGPSASRGIASIHPRALANHPERTSGVLPLALTSFIGREREIISLRELLRKTRLLTLTGPGGCGKTRLAFRVAADLEHEFPDGVWVVELAGLADHTLVVKTVADTLGTLETTGQSIVATLIAYLQNRRLLVVLDNCEHLIEACAPLADVLLRGCPDLRILATSREPLGISGESVWPVPPLSIPDPTELPAFELLRQFEGIQLFTDRASSALPSFVLNDQNARAVVELCHRLDGMPLAIELAAARSRLLTVEQIVARLDDRFRLLTTGGRTSSPRQKTLRALVDWSYDLLSEREQVTFSRLAVFAGGWSMEAAESVCSGGEVSTGAVFDLLARLVDKSLVAMEPGTGGSARYRLLETLREYAWERLRESGDADATSDRHANHYLATAEEAEPHLEELDLGRWLDNLQCELDNFRAALQWLRGCGRVHDGLRLAGTLRLFWYLRGHLWEGRRWISEFLTLDRGDTPASRAKALNAAAFLARFQGDYDAVMSLMSESLAIQRQIGNTQGIGDALNNLGYVHLYRGDYATARPMCEECLAIHRALGNMQGVADALSYLGIIAFYEANYALARSHHSESLTMWRELGDQAGIAWAMCKLGDVALNQGHHNEARGLFARSIEIRMNLGDRWGVAESLEGFACLAAARGHAARALTLAGAAATLGAATGTVGGPERKKQVERWLASARHRLSQPNAEAAMADGQAFTLADAVTYALAADPDPDSIPAAIPQSTNHSTETSQANLSRREREVVVLLARGLTNRQIAADLVISERTAERHVENILAKLGLTSRLQIAVWIAGNGPIAARPS